MEVGDGLLRKVVVCPGTGRRAGLTQEYRLWMDYVYIDWHNMGKAPESAMSRYPLAYDRRFSNHHGTGINIVLVDASVFWDERAKWLSAFARDHQEFSIPIPEP
jgi:hypothetical protein